MRRERESNKAATGKGRKPRPIAAALLAVLLALSCPVSVLFAQDMPISAAASRTSVAFGSPVLLADMAGVAGVAGGAGFSASAGAKYLETGALLFVPEGAVPADGEGVVLFIQRTPVFAGSPPPATGDFIALAHKDGFVSVFSGKRFIPDGTGKTAVSRNEIVGSVLGEPGSQAASYILQVYDGAGGLWVNPAFFVPGIDDRTAPRVEQLALIGPGKWEVSMESGKKGAVGRLPQGKYRLAARLFDPETKLSSRSGLYSFKVILDGQVVLDRKLDSARSTNNGLAFLGLGSPSSSLIDAQGRLVLGEHFIPRGSHTLEFFAGDFSGNVASLVWKLIVD